MKSMKLSNSGVYLTYADLPIVHTEDFVRALVGVEFAVVLDQGPSLFMIQKRRRVSFDEGEIVRPSPSKMCLTAVVTPQLIL